MRRRIYVQQDHSMVIDGVQITGFAEGDWLEIECEGNCVVRTEAADGADMNMIKGQGGRLTFGLLPTSKALGKVNFIRADVIANPRLFNVALLTGVREIIYASGCGFGKLPAFQTGGEVQQPRFYVIECIELDLDTSDVEKGVSSYIPTFLR